MLVLPSEAPDGESAIGFQNGDAHGLSTDEAAGVGTLRGGEIEERLVSDGFDETVAECVERHAESTDGFRGADALLSLSLWKVVRLWLAVDGNGVHGGTGGPLVDERAVCNRHRAIS